MSPGNIGKLSLTRAQTSSFSTSLTSDEVTWQEYVADVPRFYGVRQRLLIEGQRTNGIRNPLCEGAVIAGALPTNWALTTAAGMSAVPTAVGKVGGVDTVALRFSGTASATTSMIFSFESQKQVVAADGQTWAGQFFHQLAEAPLPPGQQIFRARATSAVGAPLQNFNTVISPSDILTRSVAGGTISNASTAFVTLAYSAALTVGAAYDWTVRFGWPQLELGNFASTPILPPVGTPGASTRGADLETATLASLGIGANGACTLLWSGVIPEAAPTGINQTIFCLDDGSMDNAFALHNAAAGLTLVPYNISATVTSSGSSSGSFVANTPFRAGVTINAGRIAASFNGNAVTAATGGPTSGLTTLRLGNTAAGTGAMFGETLALRYLNYPVNDSELQSLTAAMPT